MGFLSIKLCDYRNIAAAASVVWRGSGSKPSAREIAKAITAHSDGSANGDFQAGAATVQTLGAAVVQQMRADHGDAYVDELLRLLRS